MYQTAQELLQRLAETNEEQARELRELNDKLQVNLLLHYNYSNTVMSHVFDKDIMIIILLKMMQLIYRYFPIVFK